MKKFLLIVLALCAPVLAWGQTVTQTGYGQSSTVSPVTGALTVTAGHKILLIASMYNTSATGTISTPTDSQSNTYTLLTSYNNGSSTNYGLINVYTATASASGVPTISVAFSGTTQDVRFAVFDISNWGSLDQSGTNHNDLATITATASGANTASGDLVFSIIQLAFYDSATSLVHPATSGYTDGRFDGATGGTSYSGAQFDVSYKTSGASGTTDSGTWTWTANQFAVAMILTIKSTAGACTHAGLTSGHAQAVPNGTSGSYWLKNGSFGTPNCTSGTPYWQPAVGNFGLN